MSLVSKINDLATRIGTEFHNLYNGNTFIKNQSASSQTANCDIDGNGKFGSCTVSNLANTGGYNVNSNNNGDLFLESNNKTFSSSIQSTIDNHTFMTEFFLQHRHNKDNNDIIDNNYMDGDNILTFLCHTGWVKISVNLNIFFHSTYTDSAQEIKLNFLVNGDVVKSFYSPLASPSYVKLINTTMSVSEYCLRISQGDSFQLSLTNEYGDDFTEILDGNLTITKID